MKKIPILPGIQYGEIFFKEDVEKKLRTKINLQGMKMKLDLVQTKKQLTGFLLSKR